MGQREQECRDFRMGKSLGLSRDRRGLVAAGQAETLKDEAGELSWVC